MPDLQALSEAQAWAAASVFLAGAAAAMAVAGLARIGRRIPASRPAGSMPLPWRLAWPLIAALAQPAHRNLGWRRRDMLAQAAAQAGLGAVLTPGHLAAAQWLAALAAAGLAGLVLAYSDAAPATALWWCAAAGGAGAAWPLAWLGQRRRDRNRQMARELPFLLDMISLCMDAGLNVHGALQQAAERGPPGALRDEFRVVLADVRASVARLDALKALAARVGLPALNGLVSAIVQADTLGMSLGPVLQAQSERQRAERLLRAEQLALEAPVKMLLPLIACIFPCTFLVLGFPIAQRLLQVSY